MQQYHKNSWTIRNAKIHGQRGMQKFPSHQTQYEPTQFHQHEIFLRLWSPVPWGMWQYFHEHLLVMICREDAHLSLISRYNNVTSQHTYIGGYQTCVVLISKNCAQLQVLQMKIPWKYVHMCATIF
jgi:hypothetical protein